MIFIYLFLFFATTALSAEYHFTPDFEQQCKIGLLHTLRACCSTFGAVTDCQFMQEVLASTLPKEKQKKVKQYSALQSCYTKQDAEQLKQELVAHITFSDEDKELVEHAVQKIAINDSDTDADALHCMQIILKFNQLIAQELTGCGCLDYTTQEVQKQIKAGSIKEEDAIRCYRLLLLSQMLFFGT